jgi:hypothetical protein
VVVVELPEGSRGWLVLESAGGGVGAAGAATVVVVAMEGDMGSPNAGAFMTECIVAGSKEVVPRDRDSELPARRTEKAQSRRNRRRAGCILVGCSGETDG